MAPDKNYWTNTRPEARHLKTYRYDYLVLGSGSAGLSFALRVSHYGRVALITKKDRTDSNTNWAQGGIAGVMGADDNFEFHVEDTLISGAGLCDETAVRVLVTEGPESIRELIAFGAQFNHDDKGTLALGREGGHSRRRIIHTADLTGREVEHTLVEAARLHPNIEVFEHNFAIDLIVKNGACLGAYVLDEATGQVGAYTARATLLATGGAGQVYRYTTNPSIATADGIGMAYRAGAEIANMEFIQFHPTSLYHPDAKSFLISEAVRGEGGILRTRDGKAFMAHYDPERRDLAPRDIVARAIDSEIKRTGDECVYLDVTHMTSDAIKEHFPTIYARCLSYGIDMATDWIPVVPAAHYSCGGVRTDLLGRTSIDRLYACGEVASTGVHGANRLASNSLLEALVFAKRAAIDAIERKLDLPDEPSNFVGPKKRPGWSDIELVRSLRHRLQTVMQKYVGIVRTDARLNKAAAAVEAIQSEANTVFSASLYSDEILELRNILQTATLIVECAQSRRESRGLHYNLDCSETLDSERHDTIIQR